MAEKYRLWGKIVAVIFTILAVPLVVSNVLIIAFSHMNMTGAFPWESYLWLGVPVILAVFVVIMSIVSIRSAGIRSFFTMEISLIVLMSILAVLFGLTPAHRFFVLFYSLAGILQIRKFWRHAAPGVPGKYFKGAMAIMVITLAISCGGLVLFAVQSIPKMPADKERMKFVPGSLQFRDDWNTVPSLGKLARDTRIQGMLFPKYTFVFFYDSGELQMAQLAEDTQIQGIRCAASPANVHFNKAGKLTWAILASDQSINGKTYPKGAILAFNEDGTIKVFEDGQDNN